MISPDVPHEFSHVTPRTSPRTSPFRRGSCDVVPKLLAWKPLPTRQGSGQNITKLPVAQPSPPGPGELIKTEAWLVRSLVYCFSRAASRGHRPREREIRELMELADIPVPDAPQSRALSFNIQHYC